MTSTQERIHVAVLLRKMHIHTNRRGCDRCLRAYSTYTQIRIQFIGWGSFDKCTICSEPLYMVVTIIASVAILAQADFRFEDHSQQSL